MSIYSLIAALVVAALAVTSPLQAEARTKARPPLPVSQRALSDPALEAVGAGLSTQNIFVGDIRTLKFPSIKRMAVGNGKVLNAAAISANEVLIIAESPGSSVLSVWDKSGHEHRVSYLVNVEDTSKSLKDLTSLLNEIPNIKMRVVGDKVVVEGDDISGSAQEKLEMLAKQFPNLVNMTNSVTWEKMILVDVRIVEFNKQALRELGVNWSSQMQGPSAGYAKEWVNNDVYRVGNTDGVTPLTQQGLLQNLDHGLGYFGIVTSVTSQINLMAKDGRAVILAEPQLSARSGSEAHFLAGGEIPLPVRGADGEVNVFYKEYGIILDIKPESGGSGTIRASVKAEVSSVDSSMSVGGFPGFLKRQTHTEVNLKENETLVISGLVSSEMSKDISKVPFLGDLPVLGRLFRSENFRNKQTELVFFVTPRLISALSELNHSIIKKTDAELEEIRKFMFGSGDK